MRRIGLVLLLLLWQGDAGMATPARLKELVSIEGVRDNQLVGYGLVVGLNGTGDKRQTFFSAQTLANLLDRMGVQVSPTALLVRNMAAVIVTANLPAFGQPGVRMDVSVAAIGDSTNLQGGLLVLTPLKGADGTVFAVAQGSVVTGGFVAGRGGNSMTVNHPTAGRIMNGAIIEKAAPSILASGSLRLQLRRADFTTANRVVEAINKKFQGAAEGPAHAENAGIVVVTPPAAYASRFVQFIGEMENLVVEADGALKVVVNERTGTILLGKQVRIRPVAILHGSLSVEIRTTLDVSQPAPFSEGRTTVTPQVNGNVKEDAARSISLKEGATVEDLVRALTAVGSTARDVIAVLQNLQAAGALEAEVEVI
jgi:flagellar P-ring protein FlgI